MGRPGDSGILSNGILGSQSVALRSMLANKMQIASRQAFVFIHRYWFFGSGSGGVRASSILTL
jgi:hypothetical protein